ncbi:ubiquitin interaction domain-containing [Trichoderma arundinaceum]|uniref:Ubiquitin interaction domain-containing n=1 Tax=Trichoderma arundinaceum TaxID=490622 RepID=A0A395NZT6_TRIAR|nr:ubiquitin interaction domain-containing [Trichoderma arundinaceum]
MASMDPSEDEVSQVIDFAGLNPVDDRTTIINALKNNNRNVETVVMQYFDNPESFRQKYTQIWNESMFSADRDGANNNNTGISLAGGTTMHSQEEEDMQRALRESAQEAGVTLPSQESGVTDHSTSTPYFGPANRSDYDQGNWAMVPVGPLKAKLSNAPSPSQRKRAPEAPAFIVQGSSSVGNHSLGGLLTILHEIPLARNVLLQCGSPAASYGFNSEWWNGQEILPPDVLRRIHSEGSRWDGDDVDVDGAPRPNFEEEIHRLMAFLDSTERSYGTVNTLTGLIPGANSNGVEKQFYERLGEVNGEILGPLYQEATLVNVAGDDVGDEGYENARFGLLEVDHMRTEYLHIKTLYEAIDHMMWGDVLSWQEANETSKMAMFRNMGEVLAIRVGNEGAPDSLDIPEKFYPERYLTSRKEEARRIMSAWCETKNALGRVTTEERRLQEWQNDWDQLTFNKRDMIHKASDQWQALANYLETAGRFQAMESSGFDTNKYPDYRDAPCQMTREQAKHAEQVDEVLLLTERILCDMEARTEDLRTQLQQIQAKQRFLGRLLTNPDKAGRPKPMTCKEYLLRGIASERDVVYICQRLPSEPTELESPKTPADQWWRLEYCPNEDQPVRSEKVEIERVLRDIWQDTKTPLLIYATEKAVSTPRAPLSNALNMFVKSDNKAFRQELKQPAANSGEERVRSSVDPISPSKRKHRDSMDSMNSNRASIGSEDRNPFESAFDDQMEQAETELTDMSGSRSDYARGSDAESKFGDRGMPPLVPNRDPAHLNIESATLTPDTLAADDSEAQRPTPPEANQPGDVDKTAEAAVTRGPEMQERARPPSFIRPLQGKEGGNDLSMDMEISDLQEQTL